jgi:hypothetical protein
MEKKPKKSLFDMLSLTAKVVLASAIVFAGSGFLLNRLVSNMIAENLTEQTQRLTSEFVEVQARSNLTSDIFEHRVRSEEVIRQEHHMFSAFFRSVQTDNMVKIKMWDAQGTIIHAHQNFSDTIDFTAINKSFPENPRFQEAIAGTVNSEIRPSVDPENVNERGFDQLMQVYVPVYFDDLSKPAGVAEVYYRLDPLSARIGFAQERVSLMIASSFLFLFVVLFFTTKGASSSLVRQNQELDSVRSQLSKQAVELEEKVAQRTRELEKARKDLEAKLRETEDFNRLMVGREMKMKELKAEIQKLQEQLGDKKL